MKNEKTHSGALAAFPAANGWEVVSEKRTPASPWQLRRNPERAHYARTEFRRVKDGAVRCYGTIQETRNDGFAVTFAPVYGAGVIYGATTEYPVAD